jgi:hypothetical protein
MKLSRSALRVLPVVLALVAAPVASWADDSVETKFSRFTESDNEDVGSRLETAYATYTSPDTNVKVVLYGAIHIADKAYYEKVNDDLSKYEVVLFEGVSASKDAKPDEQMEAVGELQTTMGKALGLTFQKDGIDYKGGVTRNFVHADMTQDELLEATGGDLSKALPGMNMFSDPNMMKMLKPMMGMLKSMGKLPAALRNPLKLQLAQQLANSDIESMPGGGDAAKILIGARNKVALKVLDEQLQKRTTGSIAIFYGAAHMKSFHESLTKKGWTQKKVDWNTAWQIGGKRKPRDSAPTGDPEKAPATKKRWL